MTETVNTLIRNYPDYFIVVFIWLVIMFLWVLHSKRRLERRVKEREAVEARESQRISHDRLKALEAADPGGAAEPPPAGWDAPTTPMPEVAEAPPVADPNAFAFKPASTPPPPLMTTPETPRPHAAMPDLGDDEIDMGRVSQERRFSSEEQALLTQYTSGDGGGVEEMEKMLEKDPHNFQLLDWLAFMYYSNNEAEKAIQTYSRILEIDPNNASQHYYLGNSYYKVGNLARAIVHWKKVVELRPDSKYAKKATDRIQKVQGA